jgi:L-rhamnose isomerase
MFSITKDPQSKNGHLLQFVEPWGYLRQYSKIPTEGRPYKAFGMLEDNASLENLETKVSQVAHRIIQEKLEGASEARQAVRNIDETLSREGRTRFEDSVSGEESQGYTSYTMEVTLSELRRAAKNYPKIEHPLTNRIWKAHSFYPSTTPIRQFEFRGKNLNK